MSFYTSSGGPPVSETMYNGGSQLGKALSVGTADNYALSIITNGTAAISIDTSQNVTIAGSFTPTGAILAPAGTAALTGVAVGTVSNGMYLAAANSVGFSSNGTAALVISSAQKISLANSIISGAGTVSLPAYQVGETTTGPYLIGASDLGIAVGGVKAFEIKGLDVVLNNAAIATSATAGFLWMTSCAGAATGTPAGTFTGRTPMVFDSTNGRLYAYYGGAWKYAAVTT